MTLALVLFAYIVNVKVVVFGGTVIVPVMGIQPVAPVGSTVLPGDDVPCILFKVIGEDWVGKSVAQLQTKYNVK
jgi:hypothetical protein